MRLRVTIGKRAGRSASNPLPRANQTIKPTSAHGIPLVGYSVFCPSLLVHAYHLLLFGELTIAHFLETPAQTDRLRSIPFVWRPYDEGSNHASPRPRLRKANSPDYQQVGPVGNRSDRPLFQTPNPSLQDGRSERDD
jgi:hypothetical protein